MDFELTYTNKKKQCLVLNNFKYTVRRNGLRSEYIIWRCIKKGCNAKVKTNKTIDTIIDVCKTNLHHHDPYTPKELKTQELRTRCKIRAMADLTENPSVIISTEVAAIASENSPNVKNLKKNIYRERRQFYSLEKSSCNDNIQT